MLRECVYNCGQGDNPLTYKVHLPLMIWLPVESDSEIITKYAHKLGLKEQFEFIDLYSFDPSTANEFGIPSDQCKGMILLFPLPEGDKSEEANILLPESPVFIRQTIENSCCLMALLHLLLNNPDELFNWENVPETVKNLLNAKVDKSKLIEESEELKGIHEKIAKCGDSEIPEISDEVPFHFISLIPKSNSGLFVMDGRRSGPLEFSGCDLTFFELACKVAKEEFVEKSFDQTNFAAIILI